jgi:hypothetical protein
MTTPDPKQLILEQKLQRLEKQVAELNQRVHFLERENNRRRNEVNQIASAINKKG